MTNSRKILSIVSSLHSLSLYLFISKLESDDSIYFSFWEISFLIIGTNLCNLCRFLLCCYDSLRLFHFSFQYWNELNFNIFNRNFNNYYSAKIRTVRSKVTMRISGIRKHLLLATFLKDIFSEIPMKILSYFYG